MSKILFTGSCACHRITYTSTSPPSATTHCYCSTCRKLSGTSHQAFTHVPSSALTLYDNTSSLRYEGLPKADIGGIVYLRLSDFAERAVCSTCRTPLAMRYKAEEGSVGVAVGSVDGQGVGGEVERALKPEKAIFLASKPAWVEVEGGEGVRRFEGWGDGFNEEFVRGVEGGKVG